MRDIAKLWLFWAIAVLVAWFIFLQIALSSTPASWMPDFLLSIFALPVGEQKVDVLALRGQLGDSFGPFNALVSSLALVGLISTLVLQQSIAKQHQFQIQLFHAIEAYRSLLESFETPSRGDLPRPGASAIRGRSGLEYAWKRYLVAVFEAKASEFRLVAPINLDAAEASLDFAAISQLTKAAGDQSTILISQQESRVRVLEALGQAWWMLYSSHRHHLDAMFRAWYTVHRILNEAPRYSVSPRSQFLYAASFRAQVSWIEMVFLLANQSGLPHNAKFPNACRFANYFCVYDNIEASTDITVSLLIELAKGRLADPQGDELNRAAFVAKHLDDRHG